MVWMRSLLVLAFMATIWKGFEKGLAAFWQAIENQSDASLQEVRRGLAGMFGPDKNSLRQNGFHPGLGSTRPGAACMQRGGRTVVQA